MDSLLLNLIQLDQEMFHWVNSQTQNPAFDMFFPFYTDILKNPVVMVLTLALAVIWAYRNPRQRILAILFLISFTTLMDKISAWMKPFFERPRPFRGELDFEVIVRVSEPGGFSLPSGHATDAFFVATFLAFFFPKARSYAFVAALLMCYSRVYCGVHYPLDVVAGAILGALGALVALILFHWGAVLTLPYFAKQSKRLS